ncbi:hypothetical protein EON64_04965, partial [archaeon]
MYEEGSEDGTKHRSSEGGDEHDGDGDGDEKDGGDEEEEDDEDSGSDGEGDGIHTSLLSSITKKLAPPTAHPS